MLTEAIQATKADKWADSVNRRLAELTQAVANLNARLDLHQSAHAPLGPPEDPLAPYRDLAAPYDPHRPPRPQPSLCPHCGSHLNKHTPVLCPECNTPTRLLPSNAS